jgi:hypothetical protein
MFKADAKAVGYAVFWDISLVWLSSLLVTRIIIFHFSVEPFISTSPTAERRSRVSSRHVFTRS